MLTQGRIWREQRAEFFESSGMLGHVRCDNGPEFIAQTGKFNIALERGLPRSTAYGWQTGSHVNVTTLDVIENNVPSLQRDVVFSRRRHAWLIALL